jgi:hypothetical protein
MDLLGRYLQAVGQYLPEATKYDTLAELRANLLEQMDARAEELGRPLEEGDVAAILRSHGKPEVVALRYLPAQSLIGPTVFPFFKLTLVRVIPLVVLVSFIARAIMFVSQRNESLGHAIGGFALGLTSSLLITAGIITIIFAAIEWALQSGKLGDNWNTWDPAKLPALKKHDDTETPKSMAKKSVELIVHCLWFAYVLWAPWNPYWILGPGVLFFNSLHVALAPVWHVFYALLITMLTLQLVMRLLAFVSAAQRLMQPMKFVTDLLGIVAIGWLATASVYFVEAGAGSSGHDVASVNQAMGLAFKIAFLAALIGFGREVWKSVKRTRAVGQMAF